MNLLLHVSNEGGVYVKNSPCVDANKHNKPSNKNHEYINDLKYSKLITNSVDDFNFFKLHIR